MMAEMSDDVVGEPLSALFRPGDLQFRLGIIATEAMLTFGSRADLPMGAMDKAMPLAISEEEIEAPVDPCRAHHPVRPNRAFRWRLQRGGFCGDFRR
jgi:hypothetical protein